MKKNTSEYYSTTRPEMRQFIPSTYTKVLEIGCGYGNFSKNLRYSVCEIWGIEPNKDAANEAQKQLDHILVGTFSQVANLIPNSYFDLVICNDVIEHMPDHDEFLEAIKTKLTSSGVLVGSVPNILHITSFYKIFVKRDWPYKNEGILDKTHLRFFTFKSLRKCLQSHEYILLQYHGINSIITKGTHLKGEAPTKDRVFRMLVICFIAATFGYYYDSQYPQIAFAVKKSNYT